MIKLSKYLITFDLNLKLDKKNKNFTYNQLADGFSKTLSQSPNSDEGSEEQYMHSPILSSNTE
jgi:hypothetical protein